MNKLIRIAAVILLLCFITSEGYSQNPERPHKPKGRAKKYLKKARRMADKGKYQRAADYYRMSVNADSLTFDAPMEGGYTYFNDLKRPDSSLVFFRLAERNMPTPPVTVLYYYMGQAYQLTGQYDAAIKYYNTFVPHIDQTNPEGQSLKLEILRAIIDCRYARDVDQRRDSIVVANLGDKINTQYREHSPVGNEGDSILLFTARRPSNKGRGVDIQDGQFYEDMYISRKVNGQWGPQKPFQDDPYVSKIKNTADNEATVFLTYEEKFMMIHKKDHLWISSLKDGVFQDPEHMDGAVNIGPIQNHASITADGSTIYFSSNKPGGVGGFDIYRAYKKGDGSWGEAENLGPAINTKANDDSPVISPDGGTLYFASQGHLGYGGYDIFRLETEGDYQSVVNLGTPINSSADEIFFKLNKKGEFGYFGSNREGGFGDMDIYTITVYKKYFANCVPVASKEYPISFDAASHLTKKYDNARYVWETGDNASLEGMTASHKYQRPGEYIATLKVLDKKGATLTEVDVPVSIKNVTHIEFFAPDTAVTNEEVAFNASVSMIKGGRINAYKWDFGDGHRADSIRATHTYNTGGYYEVKMEVEGKIDSTNKTVVHCVSKYILVLSGDAAAAWLKAKEEREKILAAKAEEPKETKTEAPKSDTLTISLENVYFDLDKHNICPDAKEVLDRNVKTLLENPNVRIEVSAHTDSRGTGPYNKQLSNRRANSVVSYLKNAGVKGRRITRINSRGETELVNKCLDNVDCPENDHQLNRRVELKIVKK